MQERGGRVAKNGNNVNSDSSRLLPQTGSAARGAIWLALILVAIGGLNRLQAQETQKPPAQSAPASAGQSPSSSLKIPGEGLYNLLEQKSIVFPDIAASTEPLSPEQKFEIFVDNSISVHMVTWAILGSGVGQADNSPTGFGQGGDAYAKRFGSAMARHSSGEFFGTFMLASALHEDPRFFPEVNPSLGRSIKYSLQQLFVTRNDTGRRVANLSGLLGPALAEGLANAYWPERNRTVGDTFVRYGLDLAARAGGNMLREYWPVVYRKMRHSGSVGARH